MKFCFFISFAPTTSSFPFGVLNFIITEPFGIISGFSSKKDLDGFFKYFLQIILNLLKFSLLKTAAAFLVLSTGSTKINGDLIFEGFSSSNGFFSNLFVSIITFDFHLLTFLIKF